jgi:heptosyltransferase II
VRPSLRPCPESVKSAHPGRSERVAPPVAPTSEAVKKTPRADLTRHNRLEMARITLNDSAVQRVEQDSAPPPRPLPKPARLLVRGVNWLGDAVMATPAVTRLREAFPEAQLLLLTDEKLADLWRHHPAVDRVLTFRHGEGLWRVSRSLRAEAFDTALVLPNSARSALEVWLADIPRRVGVASPFRDWLLTHPVAPPPGAVRMRKRPAREIRARLAGNLPMEAYPPASHHLFHYLHLAGALGASVTPLAPFLALTEEEKTTTAPRLFERASQPFDPRAVWFGLNAGAEYGPAKRWPAERFVRAAHAVSQQTGCRWMIFGGPKDQPLAETILAELPGAASLCGQTTLRELMIGLGHCRLLLTNDTGPMHLSAALGTPVVALFGSTSPELTGPGLPGDPRQKWLRSPVPCAPCFLRECPVDFRCMHNISVDSVVQAVLEVSRQLALPGPP